MIDLPRYRSLLGQTTVLWAGIDGFREREAGWLALSGFASVEFNVALCDRASEGQAGLGQIVEEVLASGLPTLLMLAGEGLGEAQKLVEAGWICIGSVPLMARLMEGTGELDPAVRKLGADELPDVRGLIEQAFRHTPELAAVAIPDTALTGEGQALWGLYAADELVSFLGSVRVEDTNGWWSLATPPQHQGRGYGGRLCRGVLAEEARAGATLTLGWCTPAGKRATTSVGFEEVERWQLWSRPRWVLGRR
jgi:GNAT superfamily N-acetyltransferase